MVATSQYYANVHAEQMLIRYCGMTREKAQQVQAKGSSGKVVLRRDLTDSAAQYLVSHLNSYLFPRLRIVEDHGEPEDVLKNGSKGMELPPRDSLQSSSSFWIVVAAVDVVVLMIAAFFYFF